MSKDKFKVTAGGGVKLIAALFMFIAASVVFPIGVNPIATLSVYVYTLLFIFLAVNGSNSRVAQWFAERKIFTTIFFMPTIVYAFYSGIIFFTADDKDAVVAAFAILLTVLSIPFSFILIRFQGGIRRMNALGAYVAFPIVLYVICILFAKTAMTVAAAASAGTVLICIIVSVIQFSRDHKVDYSSGSDKASYGNCRARWDGHPMSNVKDNVIHLRGTVIVEYTGELSQGTANRVANELIQKYVSSVSRDMPGYSVNSASVTVKYEKID